MAVEVVATMKMVTSIHRTIQQKGATSRGRRFPSSHAARYNEMAILRYIGLLRAEGPAPPAGLPGIHAYGLSLTKGLDTQAIIQSPATQHEGPAGPLSNAAAGDQAAAGLVVKAVDVSTPSSGNHHHDPTEEDPADKNTNSTKGCSDVVGYKLMIMDFYEDMVPLMQVLDSLTLSMKKRIARHIIQAVDSLAQRQFYHLDVKPENFLVHPSTGAVRLIDLDGMVNADQFHADASNAASGPFTLHYVAPERVCSSLRKMRAGRFGGNPDLWSLGVTLLQLFMPGAILDILHLVGALVLRVFYQ